MRSMADEPLSSIRAAARPEAAAQWLISEDAPTYTMAALSGTSQPELSLKSASTARAPPAP